MRLVISLHKQKGDEDWTFGLVGPVSEFRHDFLPGLFTSVRTPATITVVEADYDMHMYRIVDVEAYDKGIANNLAVCIEGYLNDLDTNGSADSEYLRRALRLYKEA